MNLISAPVVVALHDAEYTQAALSSQRVNAVGKISFKLNNGKTCLDRLHQSGSARIKLPITHECHSEAILINTAGGLTGGDQLVWNIELGEGTYAIVSNQASEKIYRSLGNNASIETEINLKSGARLEWLPQETIIYNQSRLSRKLNVNMDADAKLLMLEMTILGRTAMAELADDIWFKDSWRISKSDKLLHAEEFLIDENSIELRLSPAALDKNSAFATLIFVGPQDMTQTVSKCLDYLKTSPTMQFGISHFSGKTICRFLAIDCYTLRKQILPILNIFREEKPMPAIWRS